MFESVKSLFGIDDTNFKSLVLKGAVIVDVRTLTEFEGGHIDGAINIPVDVIGFKAAILKRLHKPIVTCCRSGARSEMAKNILKQSGIEAYNGGAWNVLLDKIHD